MRREIRDRPLEIDEIHNLLNDPYRRDLIQILQNDENLVVTFDELLTTLAEMRTNHSAESIETDEIALRLVHIHIPHLIDAGVLDYDTKTEEIRYYRNEIVEFINEKTREIEQLL